MFVFYIFLKKEAINIVWLKRDIRLSDHLPIARAVEEELPVVILYILDDNALKDTHYDHRHWQFVRDCLVDLANQLKKHNSSVNVLQGSTVAVFRKIQEHYTVSSIFSHQETGLDVTYSIDKEMAEWCKRSKINWTEFQYNGVKRGVKNRNNWVK